VAKKCGGGATEQGPRPLCLLLAAGAMANGDMKAR
jgi:hypothetical protein